MNQSAHPSTPAPQPVTAPNANPIATDRPASVMSVMCPAGFTARSTQGLDLDRPLFARVSYRPL